MDSVAFYCIVAPHTLAPDMNLLHLHLYGVWGGMEGDLNRRTIAAESFYRFFLLNYLILDEPSTFIKAFRNPEFNRTAPVCTQ
jgi:hypothetical protein